MWWSSPTRSCGESVATTATHSYESGSSLGPKAGDTRAGYAANWRTYDFLEPKTGSVASTDDARPLRRYPR